MNHRSLLISCASALGALTLAAAITTYQAVRANRVAYLDVDGKVQASSVTDTELGYLSGVTSALQTQLDAKGGTSSGNMTNLSVTGLAFTNGISKSLTNYDTIAGGLVAADANQKLVGKTAAQSLLILGIDKGIATASADGSVTQAFSFTYAGTPVVVCSSTATNEGAHVLSVTTTNCVLATLTALSNINWIAIGTP